MIFELYEQKYVEKVYSKLNLAQSANRKAPCSVQYLSSYIYYPYSWVISVWVPIEF